MFKMSLLKLAVWPVPGQDQRATRRPGIIVEIDEAKFGRWKYHQAATWMDTGCWVASRERDGQNLFGSCSSARRGTTIYTDLWRAYDSLDWSTTLKILWIQ